MKVLKWILIAAVLLGLSYAADEQAALENAWGKPVRQNEEWRW